MKPEMTHKPLATLLATAKTCTILVRSITAEMDAEVAAVKAKFAGKISTRQSEAEAAIKAAQVYADEHREELLKEGGKSCVINGHTLGWRDNGGAIRMAKGMTEKKVLAKLLKSSGLAKLFVRRSPTLDKEAMKAKWSGFKAKLTALGVRLKHEESFFVELDVTPDATPKN